MNQRFLTNFSVVVIKHIQQDSTYCMGNESFLRSEIFLTKNQSESNFENFLFYVQIQAYGNYQFKTTIEFQQNILFRHKLSNKFLSYVTQLHDDQIDNTIKLELSDKPCYFKIIPCFQYQTKISNKVKFYEDIYFATELDSTKMGYVSIKQGENPQQLKTLIGLTQKSKIMFHSFYELQRDNKVYTYGQSMWIKHVQSNNFITTLLRLDGGEEVLFQTVQLEDNLQSINGLWLLQSPKIQFGGNLNYGQPFYLKSLCTDKYLSFDKNFREINKEKIYSLCLEAKPSQQSKFVFQSLKGEENKILRGSYLIFKHMKTGVFIGTRINKLKERVQHLPVLTFTEFQDEDLYDMQELRLSEQESIRFIFSMKRELIYIKTKLQKAKGQKISKKQIMEIEGLYINAINQLNKLSKQNQFVQVQQELGSYIGNFCSQLQLLKNKISTEPEISKSLIKLIKYPYEILKIICKDYRENQVIIFKFMAFFADDIFKEYGAEELLAEIYKNNYSLLCKLPNTIPQLKNNLVTHIFSSILSFNTLHKDSHYWQKIMKIFHLLQVFLTYKEDNIDINQRLISTELFENNIFGRIFFDIKVNNQRIRIMHPQKGKWIELEQIRQVQFVKIIEKTFHLLSKLCENRNFISKRYIDKYLNDTNKDGNQVIISYLNIPISPDLSKTLFSLVTNCYIDSSPRIDRNKPLLVIDFTIEQEDVFHIDFNRSQSLKDQLLDKSEQKKKYSAGTMRISNILENNNAMEPGLNVKELFLYKQQLKQKINEEELSPQLLRSIYILIKLESYSAAEIQDIKNLICQKILGKKINNQIIVSMLQILQQIYIYCQQLQLKKLTTYLKYKFTQSNEKQLSNRQIKYLLPNSSPIQTTFVGKQGKPKKEIQYQQSKLSMKYRNQYNQQLQTLKLLYPSKQVKKTILKMFIQEQIYSFSILSYLFKTILNYNYPKLKMIKLLSKSIIITHQQVKNFEQLFRLYKKMKHLTSISENWLCSPSTNKHEFEQYCQILVEFTNYLFQDYILNSENNTNFRKKSKLNINRQLLIANLSIHEVIMDLLNSNYYILQANKKLVPLKQLKIFSLSFEFLYYFCDNCLDNMKILNDKIEILSKFNSLIEVGQTKLSILIYSSSPNLCKQINISDIERIISKITKKSKVKSSINEEAQYNPLFVQFLLIICFEKEKIIKRNLQFIYNSIQKQIILKSLLFLSEDKKGLSLCLQPEKFKDEPLKVPILYHKNIIKLVTLLIDHLQSFGAVLKERIKTWINIEQIFKIMAFPDIYSHTGIVPEMYFLLKKEFTKLLKLLLQKAESLITIYESQALHNLLIHYTNIFIFKRQRSILHFQNEKNYLPFLEAYKHSINYDTLNERDYFANEVQPLLAKLFSIFEKYSSKDSNKNYAKIIILLQNVKISQLSQDHLLKNNGNAIDLINLKWRNFVDSDEDNSIQEKFTKQTVLQVLRNAETHKEIQEERQLFFQTLKEKQENYFKIMAKLIKMASLEQNQSVQSQQSLEIFYQMIRSLAEYFVERMKKSTQKKGWQGQQLAQTLIQFVTRQSFQYNNSLSRKIFYQILRILVFLLQNDQEGTLAKFLYKIFAQNTSCFRFFNCLKESINQISYRLEGQKSHEQINLSLSEIYLCGEQKKCQIDKRALQFMTLLCKRHIPFTDMLRSQPYNISTDFFDKIYNSFYVLVKRQNTKNLQVSITVVDITQKILDCVQSMLNGCNQVNQNYIIDNKFPDIVIQALKMESIHDNRNKGELAKRNRIIQQVCQFYEENGIEIRSLIDEKIQLLDYRHSYLLNRLKYILLKLLVQTTIANERGLIKIRILVPVELLKINLIWIYEDFTNEKIEYSQNNILRKKEQWSKVIKDKELHSVFLMIGFYYFNLIQYSNQVEKDGGDQDNQTSYDQQKQKQKIVRKFFSSISQNHKKEERLKDLEKERFAEQMKLFYNKYYEAYNFFYKRSLTIEANVFNHLVKIYFPRIPLCDKLTEKEQQKFIQQAERISHEQKIKSLMVFQNDTYQFLQGQQDYFRQMSTRSQLMGKITRLVKDVQVVFLVMWGTSIIIILGYLLDDFASPSKIFADNIATYIIPTTFLDIFMLIFTIFNVLCGVLLLINLILRKIPFLMRLYDKKYQTSQQKQQNGIFNSRQAYQIKNVFSQSFFDSYMIIFSILSILHPLFAGFLLVYIVKRIALGKQIVKAIQQTWFNLLVVTGLLLVFNYIFAIFIYSATFTEDIGYGTTCKTLFKCVLMLVDQSLKAGSGFLATNTPNYINLTLSVKVISQIIYILFAQKVIFQIFSGTIIDKFSQLRQKGSSTEEDEESNCFICGQERFQIDFQLEGFEQHVQKNHNKINYVYYLFYLRRLASSEYGISESYIWNCHEKELNSWIPDGTSLMKTLKEEDKEEENKISQVEQYEHYYQKKLQELKKLHTKVQIMSYQLKEDNKSL